MRTQRELQVDTEKMKEALFSLNMKLELVRKQNNDLKDQVEQAEQRVEELEPLEEENHELRDTNDQLTLKLQNVTEEAIQLQDRNAVILKLQDESVETMEKQHAALEEATEIIIRLESEKSALAQENSHLKSQVTELQHASAGTHHARTDGTTDRYPSRVYSVDESRPSTSHFDSDYYSQPASPQAKTHKQSKESLPDVALSDRARNFLSLKREGRKSIQDLKKRLSDASLVSARPVSSVPEVPPIPEPYQEQPQQPAIRTPRRTKPLRQLPPASVFQPESVKGRNAAPRTPTETGDGLRGMFRGGLTLDTSVRNSQPTSNYNNSPLETRASRPPRALERPTPPARQSSKNAAKMNSQEQLRELAKEELGPDNQLEDEEEPSEWAEIPPPPSIISDLTTELDNDPREQWWRNMDSLQYSTPKDKAYALSLAMVGPRPPTEGTSRAPYMETDFFFNGAEDEDQFMRRAKSYGKKC
jgi:hypothetical protein